MLSGRSTGCGAAGDGTGGAGRTISGGSTMSAGRSTGCGAALGAAGDGTGGTGRTIWGGSTMSAGRGRGRIGRGRLGPVEWAADRMMAGTTGTAVGRMTGMRVPPSCRYRSVSSRAFRRAGSARPDDRPALSETIRPHRRYDKGKGACKPSPAWRERVANVSEPGEGECAGQAGGNFSLRTHPHPLSCASHPLPPRERGFPAALISAPIMLPRPLDFRLAIPAAVPLAP